MTELQQCMLPVDGTALLVTKYTVRISLVSAQTSQIILTVVFLTVLPHLAVLILPRSGQFPNRSVTDTQVTQKINNNIYYYSIVLKSVVVLFIE